MNRHIAGKALLAAALATASLAHAGVTWQAVSVATPGGPDGAGWGSNHLIDQSGLSANYVSGVTDFATFVAGTTATYGGIWNASTALGGAAGNTPTFLFDLGAAVTVSGVAVWNQSGTASLLQYDVYGSTDGINYSLLGNGSVAEGGFDVPGYTASWSAQSARWIELRTVANNGYPDATRFNEIVFDVGGVPPVPAPGTLALLGISALGLAVRRKRSA